MTVVKVPLLDHCECGLIKGVMQRDVQPEILDSLPGSDPRAVRGRRDLRLINFLMGNERWIMKKVDESEVIELGAGAGDLTAMLAKRGAVTGLDFQEKPDSLEVPWLAGDLFETFAKASGNTVVANLILHHFKEDELARLGHLIRSRHRLIAVEPWRSRLALFEGRLLWPFVNEVTRHDMMASIRAGFRKGELEEKLDLGSDWEWREEVSLLGGIRVVAWRR